MNIWIVAVDQYRVLPFAPGQSDAQTTYAAAFTMERCRNWQHKKRPGTATRNVDDCFTAVSIAAMATLASDATAAVRMLPGSDEFTRLLASIAAGPETGTSTTRTRSSKLVYYCIRGGARRRALRRGAGADGPVCIAPAV